MSPSILIAGEELAPLYSAHFKAKVLGAMFKRPAAWARGLDHQCHHQGIITCQKSMGKNSEIR
jgi:hypothetical protein